MLGFFVGHRLADGRNGSAGGSGMPTGNGDNRCDDGSKLRGGDDYDNDGKTMLAMKQNDRHTRASMPDLMRCWMCTVYSKNESENPSCN